MSMTSLPVIVLAGPTAVGKTTIALRLAERMGTEIVGADSRQIYRRMDIGTAKPTRAEQERVPHHLIDVVDPDERYDAARYARAARRAIRDLQRSGRIPLLVGGTGLYLRACLEGLCPAPGADPVIRRRLRREEESQPGSLHRRLRALDPVAADRIPPGDRVRQIRALEIHELTGRPASEIQAEHAFADRPFRAVLFYLHRDRASLVERIDRRLDRMMKQGFLQEVQGLLEAGYARSLPSMSGLGYRQLAAHLDGERDLTDALAATRVATRRLAKRQTTWFRGRSGYRRLDLDRSAPEEIEEQIVRVIQEER